MWYSISKAQFVKTGLICKNHLAYANSNDFLSLIIKFLKSISHKL